MADTGEISMVLNDFVWIEYRQNIEGGKIMFSSKQFLFKGLKIVPCFVAWKDHLEDTRKTVFLWLNQSLQERLEAFSEDFFFQLSLELLLNSLKQ